MIRTLLASIALAGLVASSYAASIPLDGSEINESIGAPFGTANIHYGDGQRRIAHPERYIAENMFDGVVAADNFYSMGMGGVVQIDLNEPKHFVDNTAFIEVTWDNGGDIEHHEAAEIWWGTENEDGSMSYVEGALLLNCSEGYLTTGAYSDWNIVAADVNTDHIMAWKAYVPTDADYSSLYIRDVTLEAFGSTTSSFDGFDIGEITYSAIPEPASIAFLGISMLSIFGLAYKRKK